VSVSDPHLNIWECTRDYLEGTYRSFYYSFSFFLLVFSVYVIYYSLSAYICCFVSADCLFK